MSATSRTVPQIGVVWVALAALVLSRVGVTVALVAGTDPGPVLVTVSMLAWRAVLLVYPSGVPEPRWLWFVAAGAAVGVLAQAPSAFVSGFRCIVGGAGVAPPSARTAWLPRRVIVSVTGCTPTSTMSLAPPCPGWP